MNSLWRSNFMIKLRNWEHWPFLIIQLPILPYYIWLSLRAKSFSFFSTCNPGIAMGGLLGESKYDILKKLPPELTPRYAFVPYPGSLASISHLMYEYDLTFPVIFKPDIGEGGWMVEKINSIQDIRNYLKRIKSSFIIQEFIEDPIEYGVFYRRFPTQRQGAVISLTRKKFLTITGDGKSSIGRLVINSDRAKLHFKKLKKLYSSEWNNVLSPGEKKVLMNMGNHIQGATFYDNNHLINEELNNVFDSISRSIDGFYYGKFDIRCNTVDDLYNGNIKILELNGCGATPSHIFEPGKSYYQCIKRLLMHWKDIYTISIMNKSRGLEPIPVKEAWRYFISFMRTVGR